MLSVDDIKNIKFRRASFGGYKPEDVDNFIDDVQMSYEKLLRDKYNLHKEIENLNAKIKKYHEEEGCIRDAILAAQRLADSSVKEAKSRAEKILSDAQSHADKIYSESNDKLEKSTNDYKTLKRESKEFRDQLIELYKKHLELINEIPIEGEESKIDLEVEMKSDESKSETLSNENNSNESNKPRFLVESDEQIGRENDCIQRLPIRKYENLKFGANYDIKSDLSVR